MSEQAAGSSASSWKPPRRAGHGAPRTPRGADGGGSMVVREAFELAAAARVLELAQGLGLDLADALAGDLELLADLLEGVLVAVAQAEAHLEDPALAVRQRFQGLLDLLLEVDIDDRVVRGGEEVV